ncbi:MAG: hypothetical protein S4CHLAM45_12570 [Chlamydiales bacterium]|nr:hypothetical protein [Chlamydiales bacterium]MCH9619746.1 hypothetical protein [Chlamydiales bacterium]MCH9623352.1 hypothetical protein [Chlamydiales bacterium]
MRLGSFILFLALAGCVAKGAQQTISPSKFLYIMNAKQGHYDRGTLTLADVNSTVTYFSQRPNRRAGTMKLDLFLKAWSNDVDNNFNESPPNAAIVFYDEQKKELFHDVPVLLKNPTYQGELALLSFDLSFLDSKIKIENDVSLFEISLFIDSSE